MNAKIETFSDLSSFATPLENKQLPAFAGNLDVQPMYLESTQILDKEAGFFNLFQTTDPQQIAAAWAAVEGRAVDLGWFTPASAGPTQYFAVKSLKDVALSAANFVPDPTQFHF